MPEKTIFIIFRYSSRHSSQYLTRFNQMLFFGLILLLSLGCDSLPTNRSKKSFHISLHQVESHRRQLIRKGSFSVYMCRLTCFTFRWSWRASASKSTVWRTERSTVNRLRVRFYFWLDNKLLFLLAMQNIWLSYRLELLHKLLKLLWIRVIKVIFNGVQVEIR